jgi:hypothetical protein
MGMFYIGLFAVYYRQLKLHNTGITQNVLMPAVDMLKLPAQNVKYADEYQV